jgi:hypothetical protein
MQSLMKSIFADENPMSDDEATERNQRDGDAEYQLAAVVARHVELRNIGLVSLEATLRKPLSEAVGIMTRGDAEAALESRTGYQLAETGLLVTVRTDFQVRLGPVPSPEECIVLLKVGYALEYDLSAPPPGESREKLLTAFAKVNGIYNAWPYLREIVQTTCARMSIPPPVLPVYRVLKPSAKRADTSIESKGTG